jgi:hypothetical protein
MNAIRIKNADRKFNPFNSSILPWAGLANTVFRILGPVLPARAVFLKRSATITMFDQLAGKRSQFGQMLRALHPGRARRGTYGGTHGEKAGFLGIVPQPQ